MGKLLSWVVIGFALYVAFKVVIALQRKSKPGGARASDPEGAGRRAQEKPDPALPLRLVSCARCGLQLPADEALERGGQPYCGQDHARLGPRAKDAS